MRVWVPVLRLLQTNNPRKISELSSLGIKVTGRIPCMVRRPPALGLDCNGRGRIPCMVPRLLALACSGRGPMGARGSMCGM